MPTFKPGDRVRALKDDYRIKAGQVFTVYTAVRSTLELSNGYTYWAANFERVNTTASAKQAQEEMRFETVEPRRPCAASSRSVTLCAARTRSDTNATALPRASSTWWQRLTPACAARRPCSPSGSSWTARA